MIKALHPRKFPMFAARLIAGINLIEPLMFTILKKTKLFSHRSTTNVFVSTLFSALLSALVNFPTYQNHIIGYDRFNSLDLTLLVATRAIDTVFSSELGKIVPTWLVPYGDVVLFTVSSAFIMYSWFFHVERLPPAYHQWITSAANMDHDIYEVLRLIKSKKLVYGEPGPYSDFLGPYFEKYGKDPKDANTTINLPISCEAVHAFKTKSCELHALWRFYRGFKFAFTVYGPLNLLLLLLPKKKKMSQRLLRALTTSVRSSAFLGAFIGIYWYSVCLARTRLFPLLAPKVPRTRYDDTIAPAMGAIMCGLSSLVETPQRRKELALFVAPRGLGTLVSADATTENLQIESIVFSVCLAILVAYSKSKPSTVRGIFGKGLNLVFNIDYYK
ncbi:uncharacterized protein SPAPADRAFT_58439 [Spathaspora passalidarum NRRL Y-27907]|uniref:Transmembrane protein 135 N-terminal domain-containing protein n=1 Tax=Spathaspora passalidarum (strain NRRL Y-27907 / 11-Y1) TaxID=619300 RepID=G3AG96_SPAPN|nr:uncharacterized protein SPAPADRAFT_58439 [Spathaspora passalidarum NRRL Y-27907]EGW35235.1 hypothetical protein SPAPADRAFT_58439 [Spathaspora passalidarum NRRL Y-27907]